jgi:hypothetical protein
MVLTDTAIEMNLTREQLDGMRAWQRRHPWK